MGGVLAAIGFIETAVNFCNEVYKAVNVPVSEEPYSGSLEAADASGVHVLVCALDYKRTSNPLSCSIDGRNMEKLFQACGIPAQNVRCMYDEECTKDNVLDAIADIGGRCEGGDYFIFYYSGHGTNLKDISGDEEDGQDEAFCFVNPDGQIDYGSCMTDDTFADKVNESVDQGAKILILTDCCHSGTIADFHTGDWSGRAAISIAGCLDSQTSGDIGRGGIFTHSMLMAIAEFQQQGESGYSVGKLFNRTLTKDQEVFNSKQDITLQCSPGQLPNNMAWPLIPQENYTPPYGRRSAS